MDITLGPKQSEALAGLIRRSAGKSVRLFELEGQTVGAEIGTKRWSIGGRGKLTTI